MSISLSKYKNKNSVVLENSKIRAEFIPSPGGKLISLIDKLTGYEYMVQRSNGIYRDQPFDGIYTEGECSGFDDMFPTIDACEYQLPPWKGVKMSDHGEVWSLPWTYRILENMLEMEVNGIRYPYLLKKMVSLTGDNGLQWTYKLFNNSESDFEFLWAGHFMINAVEGLRIELPPDCKEAVSVLSASGREYGETVGWPFQKDKDKKVYRADIMRSASERGFEKFYFSDKLEKGWCRLIYPDGKLLTISFSSETVPYLGLLVNENGWDGLYNLFVEPCTVCFDRPDVARQYGQISKVNARGIYTWSLQVNI
ncbi:MAG: hypothetical protein M9904_06015 [Chitinophagaceae bacterium]|nr:hypothetical protein [Chitinophagaceae bacterium]